jgi:hypothetical protein
MKKKNKTQTLYTASKYATTLVCDYLILFSIVPAHKKNNQEYYNQGLTKRCLLSWLTNSALVYEPKSRLGGLRGLSHAMKTAVPMETK